MLLVRRGAERRFAGGFHAFPGGRLDPEDADVPVAGATRRGRRARRVRARASSSRRPACSSCAAPGGSRRRTARRGRSARILDGGLGWGAFLAAHGLALDAALLAPAGRWVTPEHLPLRYDARLFLARAPRRARPPRSGRASSPAASSVPRPARPRALGAG